MKKKIKIGGILEVRGLTLIKLLGIPNKPGYAGKLLEGLGDANINLHFVAESEDLRNHANITICVSSNDAKNALEIIEKQRHECELATVDATPGITALTIYGPHFREKPAICSRMCAALGENNINIYGISTSISSICCLISEKDYNKAYKALLSTFELP
ncbi:MAG: ACT domain-containing protein [FCB group bacterium]|nr:ACT domain-containing protein [FCB group bacterium]